MGKLSHLKKAIEGAKRRVYQGSPHKYDGKLDHSKIGTGEGAQAYGYGHYLAENKGVAKSYRDGLTAQHNLGIPSTRAIGEMPSAAELDAVKAANVAMRDNLPVRLRDKGGKFTPAFRNYHSYYNFRNDINYYDDLYMKQHGDDVLADIEKIKQIKKDNPEAFEYLYGADFNPDSLKAPYRAAYVKAGEAINQIGGGHLYEFDLPESAIDNMLDWDAPLSEQPERIQDAISKARDNIRKLSPEYADNMDITGEGLYQLYREYRGGSSQAASEGLKELGIPGIKYHDGMSRAAGEGTRNFVIFPGNEDMVKAVSRNGEKLSAAALAPLAGIGLMGTFSEDSQAGVGGTIKAAGKALDMSDVARMQRAKDMGFDTDTVYYHGTDMDFTEFDTSDKSADFSIPNNLGDNIGAFFSKQKSDAERFGPNVGEYHLALTSPKRFRSQEDFRRFIGENTGLSADIRDKEGWIIEEGKPYYNARAVLEDQGYDGVIIDKPGYDTESDKPWAIAFNNNRIRSINADFDPAKKDSANLLASMGGAAVLGGAALTGATAPGHAQASDVLADFAQRRAAKKDKWKSVRDIYKAGMEVMAGINRGAVDTLNFLGPDQVNAVLQLSGSDRRVPDLYDIPGVPEGTAKDYSYMDEGLARDIVRTGGEFFSPL